MSSRAFHESLPLWRRYILSLNQKFLDTQEEKDRLQQNIAIIKLEEKLILKRILNLEHWLKVELLFVALAAIGIVGVLIWEFFVKNVT